MLQARPGAETNLLVVTNDGQVYSYILKYSENLSKLNYFIKDLESLGNEKPKRKMLVNQKTDVSKRTEENEVYYKMFCRYLLKAKFNPIAVKRKGLILKLMQTVCHKDKLYIVFEIKNNWGIDFEVN